MPGLLTVEERQTLIDRIRTLPERLEALVGSLSDAQLVTHFLAGEWSVAQNVHHLADSHLNSFVRLKLILSEEQPALKPYDQERWAECADANNSQIADSLQLLAGLHRRWVTLFESLTEQQWQREGVHPEVGLVTPVDLVITYAKHGDDHLDQIRRTLNAER